ncbi:MAG: OmpA family protein [Cytophagales bacterium]|nr:OmpA family protein [Cytophagales bacterium]
MNIKFFLILILLKIPIIIKSQSFEKDFIIEKNQIPYLFNEINSYTNHDETLMIFNSNQNPNNIGGYSDLNDVWLRIKKENLWTFPINLSEINTDGNDLLLGVDQEYFYLLRDNKVLTYSFKEQFIFISEEIIKGFENNFEIISGSINTSNNIIFLSFQGFGSYGVEDIYYSKKTSNSWSRLVSTGSSLNSSYQELSPYLLSKDTLLFISNSMNDGYNLYYSVSKNNSFSDWTEPVKLEKLNTLNSEYSISQNLNKTSFFVSYSKDSRTNYDIYEYKHRKNNNSILLTLNFKNDLNSGIIEVSSKNNFYANIDIINNSSKIEVEQKGEYNIKVTSESYFILDTLLSIDKTQSIDLSLTKIQKGTRKELSNINFLRSSTQVTDESLPYLNDLLHLFKGDKSLGVIIEGHTDNSGDYRQNIKLSKERALVIKKFLTDNGVDKNKIKVKGYGPSKPRYSNSSEVSKIKNRRVEIYIDN